MDIEIEILLNKKSNENPRAKNYNISLIIREIQIKTAIRYQWFLKEGKTELPFGQAIPLYTQMNINSSIKKTHALVFSLLHYSQ